MKKWIGNMMTGLLAVILFLPNEMAGYAIAKRTDIPLERIKLPPGFKIAIFATDIPNARSMVMSPDGRAGPQCRSPCR